MKQSIFLRLLYSEFSQDEHPIIKNNKINYKKNNSKYTMTIEENSIIIRSNNTNESYTMVNDEIHHAYIKASDTDNIEFSYSIIKKDPKENKYETDINSILLCTTPNSKKYKNLIASYYPCLIKEKSAWEIVSKLQDNFELPYSDFIQDNEIYDGPINNALDRAIIKEKYNMAVLNHEKVRTRKK